MASKQQQKQFLDEAMIKQPTPEEDREGAWPSVLTIIGFGFLTFNSFMAVYRSNGDVGSISFVVFSYLVLVLLFYCLRRFETTPPESPSREHIKMAVLVWAMAGATVFGGFYAFFIHQEKTAQLEPPKP
uniref:Uncharacterized protein n=1 Tax=Zea mays TaxID=4577 RepID=A0A804P353_MAIZE